MRSECERAIVEALFDVSASTRLLAAAEEAGLEPDDGQFVVRREIAASGAHRTFVNGSPVTLGPLRQLGELLLEPHAQHEALTLTRADRQLELIDGFGVSAESRDAVEAAWRAVADRRAERDRLAEAREERERIVVGLRAIVEEIDAVAPESGELDRLDRERALLRRGEEVREWLDRIVTACDEGEPSAVDLVAQAARAATRLAELDPDFTDTGQRLESCIAELQDAAATARDWRERADVDPARLEAIEERRVALERLMLRHGEDEAAVLRARDEAATRLAELDDVAGSLQRLDEEIAEAGRGYADAADVLAAERREAAARLCRRVHTQFKVLALGKARVGVAWSGGDGAQVLGADGAPRTLDRRGSERPQLMLAANPGEPPAPLAKAASGGELSRILLAILVAAGDQADPVRVFDEIDAGVGGAVADAVGARLARLAQGRQVLAVTHAPQVAAHADLHLSVSKRTRKGRTVVDVNALDAAAREVELARMVGGRVASGTSKRHARELLDAAAAARKSQAGGAGKAPRTEKGTTV